MSGDTDGGVLQPHQLLAPLRHRDFRCLMGATWVSLLGDGFFFVALALQVYAISNVPTAMAAVGIAWTASQVAFLLPGGLASDRFERRQLMVVADLVRAGAIGTLGLLSVSGQLRLVHMVVLGCVFGMGNAFFNPAVGAIVPTLVPEKQLAQANALTAMARPAMQQLAGPALGGFIVHSFGPGAAFLIDAATFVLSATFVWAIAARPVAAVPGGGGLAASLREIGEGLAYVRATPWLWAWFAAAGLSLLAFAGPFEVLVPFVLTNELGLGARELGLVFAFGGLGSIAVSALVGRFELPRRFMTALYLVEASAIALLCVFGVMTQLWQAVVASLIMHGLFAFTEIVWATTVQRLVPDRLLGRVYSLDWFASMGLMPISFAVAGPLAVAVGARQVLVGGALLGSGMLVALLFVPGARLPQHLPAPEEEPAVAGAVPIPPDLQAASPRR